MEVERTVASPATGLLETQAADASVPTRMRSLSHRPKGGFCFIAVIFTAIATIYGIYLTIVQLPALRVVKNLAPNQFADERSAQSVLPLLLFTAFHVCFALFLASFFKAMSTDPGGVPPNWGMYVGDEARRRRYCRVCNVWKPNRTHHCSHCGRCILNMDHHCPWINNCVGFYNRKFFIQTLIYANVTLTFVLMHSVCHVAVVAREFWPYSEYNWNDYNEATPVDFVEWALTLVLIATACVILAGLIPFTRFHWHLLIVNSTTIESMDPSFRDHALYDLGTKRNIEQVFGPTLWLWWLPFHVYKSWPVGDGVRWRRHYLRDAPLGGGYDG